jgi:hypothetical protein
MNRCAWLLPAACAIMLSAPIQSQTNNSTKGEKGTVTALDGTKCSGFIKVTDDYTIRIMNDSGITRFPIAQLGESDFQEYGFRKNRARDGRFWYERKEALTSSEKDARCKTDAQFGGKSSVESRLKEISAFQPFITAYENSLASRKSDQSTDTSQAAEKTDTYDVPFRPMFSEPGLGGPLPQPFSVSGLAIHSVTGEFGGR